MVYFKGICKFIVEILNDATELGPSLRRWWQAGLPRLVPAEGRAAKSATARVLEMESHRSGEPGRMMRDFFKWKVKILVVGSYEKKESEEKNRMIFSE